MTWRIRLLVMGAMVVVAVLAMLPSKMESATAAVLLQPPPTPTSEPPATPTSEPPATPTTEPAATPTTEPAATPTSEPGATPTPRGPAPTRKPGGGGGAPPGPSGTPVVNGCVKSVGRDGISLGSEPGFYKPHVQIIPRGRLAQVLAGPERADTIWWWRLRTDAGVEGWGNQDEMTPDPGPCAFGAAGSVGASAPPYPVTILPSSGQNPVVEQVPVQSAPPAQVTPQVTATQQETLPQTGDGLEWWFLAGLLAATVIVVGYVRRRLQTQPAASSHSLPEDETDIRKR